MAWSSAALGTGSGFDGRSRRAGAFVVSAWSAADPKQNARPSVRMLHGEH
jgi:hypothetical protein